MKKFILLIILGLFLAKANGQTSEKIAKEIMGSKFISGDSAYAAWKKIAPSISNVNLTIPYSVETLKKFAAENNNGKNYYLVPILGLNRPALAKFWKFGLRSGAGASGAKYVLLDFPAEGESLGGYEGQTTAIQKDTEKMAPMLDYIEAIATIRLIRPTAAISPQLKVFFIGDSGSQETMEIYSTLITDSVKEIVIMNFPKENYMTGYINNRYAYYFAGKELEQIVFSPVKIIGLKKLEEVDFAVAVATEVKPPK